MARRLERLGGAPVLRMAKAKMGPVVSGTCATSSAHSKDNGNFIIDAHFGVVHDPRELELVRPVVPQSSPQKINMIPGVVECGLFVAMAARAYVGSTSGDVTVLERGSE